MAKSPAASLTIYLTSRKDVDASTLVRREFKGQKRIYLHVEAVNYLLNAYATNDEIANVASKIESFKKLSSQTAAQFADALKVKALQCRNGFSKKQTKSIFVKGIPLYVQDNMRI